MAWSTANHRTPTDFPPFNCTTTNVYYDANNAHGGRTGNIKGA